MSSEFLTESVQPPDRADLKSLSRQRYNQFAQGYVASQVHAKGEELNRLVKVTQPQPDWIVLDAATGGGHTALRFAPYVAQVIATDLTPNMLRAARAFITGKGMGNVEFRLADAENLPFEAETFDLVTCRIAPHHFPNCTRFLRECARVLKLGGLLLVQDHVLPDDEQAARYVDRFEKLRDPSHNRAYDEGEWRGMFRDAGLSVEHTEQLIKRHEFVAWVERQGCSPQVIERLLEMMRQAPKAVAEWMRPRAVGTPEATFVNHHIIIVGRKG